jgi:hypothetical protein
VQTPLLKVYEALAHDLHPLEKLLTQVPQLEWHWLQMLPFPKKPKLQTQFDPERDELGLH